VSVAWTQPSLAIHSMWKPETDAVMAVLPEIEAKLAPFQARPHWAKVFTMESRTIEPLYPRFKDFRALAQEFDTKGKFRNRFIRDHVDWRQFGIPFNPSHRLSEWYSYRK